MKNIQDFFARSDLLDYMVLRPLSHIKGNWELAWDQADGRYREENESFANDLNNLLDDLNQISGVTDYHRIEDKVAEYIILHNKWEIKKKGRIWVGKSYEAILEQGGFHDDDQKDLMIAAKSRIDKAVQLNQLHFDSMEKGHRKMLAGLLSIILYHRWNHQ